MRKRPVALLASALAMGAMMGPAAGVQGSGAETSGLKTRLPNGLTVIVRENRTAPLVAASLFVRVGPGWEAEDEAGITNLLQQVIVKGTATRSALAIAEAAEGMGGRVSASADMDSSEIRGTALGRRWRDLLELLADIALRPSLPVEEVEGERRLVLRAIRNRRDQPFPLAFDTMMSRLYGHHPYARSAVGKSQVVEKLDRETLAAHHRRYFRAGRMILSVSGDVTAGDVVAETERLFAAAAPGDGEADPGRPAASALPERVEVTRPSAQVQVLMGFIAPPASHPDYAAVKVLATALGGGMSGRLFAELRDKQGLAYSTGATYPTRIGPSYFLLQLGTAPANAARAEEGMRREIERVQALPLGDGELERAKSYLLGQFALDRRTNARLAWYAAFFEAAGVGHDYPERYVRAVGAVTALDVQRVAKTYLAWPTIVSLGPAAR
jgi:predicted Zn-dependent peptidase